MTKRTSAALRSAPPPLSTTIEQPHSLQLSPQQRGAGVAVYSHDYKEGNDQTDMMSINFQAQKLDLDKVKRSSQLLHVRMFACAHVAICFKIVSA